MTRGDLKARIKKDLDDAGAVFFTNSDIETSIDEGYVFITALCNSFEKTIDISFTKDTPYYNITEIIPSLFAITDIYYIGQKRFLDYKPRNELLLLRPDYEIWSGNPFWFYIHSQQRFGICPVPVSADLTQNPAKKDLKIFYREFDLSVVADIDSFNIPSTYIESIASYCVADLLEQQQEWTKADFAWGRFYKLIVDGKLIVRNRPLPALVHTMQGLSFVSGIRNYGTAGR